MNEFASGVYGRLFDDGTGYVYKVFYTENKDNESGWIREIVALKNLSHPNILSSKFIGFNFTTDPSIKPKTNIYIKMKKYSQLLKIRTPLNDLDILQAILDLFNGLAYMHSRFIMHRDIKEANLLYEPPDQKIPDRQIAKLIICDFSLARFSIVTDDIKRFNYLTPETVTSSHRAPEVFQSIRSNEMKGLRKCKIEYNELVDVWSAGIVMFFLLTGLQLYYTIFCFEKNNADLLDFISKTDSLKSLNPRWNEKDRDKIYSELLMSHFSIPFIRSLLDKYINKNLKYVDFYKDIFAKCISFVKERPSAIELTSKISKHILDNDLSNQINDCGFVGTPIIKPVIPKSKELDKHVQIVMEEALQRINSKDVRGMILNKISLIMNYFCNNAKKLITEISSKYIVAAAHIIEIMFLYENITIHFRSDPNVIYQLINGILMETAFLEGLF